MRNEKHEYSCDKCGKPINLSDDCSGVCNLCGDELCVDCAQPWGDEGYCHVCESALSDKENAEAVNSILNMSRSGEWSGLGYAWFNCRQDAVLFLNGGTAHALLTITDQVWLSYAVINGKFFGVGLHAGLFSDVAQRNFERIVRERVNAVPEIKVDKQTFDYNDEYTTGGIQ
jgi:hypothetical protein